MLRNRENRMKIKLPMRFEFELGETPKFLTSLNKENIAAFEKSIFLVQDSIHHKPHYLQHSVLQLKAIWDKKNEVTEHVPFTAINAFSKILLEAKRFSWEKEQSKKLSQKNFWKELFANELLQNDTLKHIGINSLYVLWKDQAYFVLHSNESLLWLLPIVEKTLFQAHLALVELEQYKNNQALHKACSVNKEGKSVVTDLLKEWRKFLTDIQTEFEKIKKGILAAMYVRLVVANYAYETYGHDTDDVIWYIQDILQKKVQYPAAKVLLPPRQTLTPTIAREFLTLLYQKSEHHLIRRYDELNFSCKLSSVSMVSVCMNKKMLLIPIALRRFYPTWKGKPAWIFSDRHARAEFFERQQKNFIHIKWPLPAILKDLPLTSAQQKIFLCALDEEDKFIHDTIEHEKNYKIHWWQIRTRQLKKGWQAIFEFRQAQVTQQRLKFIEKIVEQPLPKDRKEKLLLWQRLLHCYRAIDQILLSKEDTVRLQQVWHTLAVKLEQTPELYAWGLISAIARKELVACDDYQVLFEMLDTLKLGDTAFDSKKFGAPFTTQCLKQLIQKVKWLLKVDQAYDEMLIKSHVSLITIFDNQSAIQTLQKHISNYVIRHLLNLLHYKPHQLMHAQCAAIGLEKFVKDYGNDTLKNNFQTLANIRCSQSWQVYCEAVQEMVEQLSKPHKQRYFSHEVTRVNSALDFILATQAKEQSQTNAYSAVTDLFHNIVERLVNAKTARIENIPLAPHEQTLVGIHHAERKVFQEAVELKAAVILSSQYVEQNPAALNSIINHLQNLSVRYPCVMPHLNSYISHKKSTYVGFFAKPNKLIGNIAVIPSITEIKNYVAFHRI